MGSFQDLLNRLIGTDANYNNMGSYVPSQMPGAMGGGFDHGIAGNLSDIQQMPVSGMIPGMAMGNMAGTQIAQGQGGFNVFNPFTYGNMKKAIDKTRAGDENVEYSDTPVGGIGKAANEKNRLIQQMLQGY